jgi:hypothetical protein
MGLITEIIDNYWGRVILSIIWGLGLATMFRKVCKGRNCIVIKAPDNKEIVNNTYRFNDKCYKFKSTAVSCKKKKKKYKNKK